MDFQDKLKSDSTSPVNRQAYNDPKLKHSKSNRDNQVNSVKIQQFVNAQAPLNPLKLIVARQDTINQYRFSQMSNIASTEHLQSNKDQSGNQTPIQNAVDERLGQKLKTFDLPNNRNNNSRDTLQKGIVTPSSMMTVDIQNKARKNNFYLIPSNSNSANDISYQVANQDQSNFQIIHERSGRSNKNNLQNFQASSMPPPCIINKINPISNIYGPSQLNINDYTQEAIGPTRQSSIQVQKKQDHSSAIQLRHLSQQHNNAQQFQQSLKLKPAIGSQRHSDLFFKIGHKQLFKAYAEPLKQQPFSNLLSSESTPHQEKYEQNSLKNDFTDKSLQFLHDHPLVQTITKQSQFGIGQGEFTSKKERLSTCQSKIQMAIKSQHQMSTAPSETQQQILEDAIQRTFQTQGIYDNLRQKSVAQIYNKRQFGDPFEYQSGSFIVDATRDRSRSIEQESIKLNRKKQVNIQLKSLRKLTNHSQQMKMPRNLPQFQAHLKSELQNQLPDIMQVQEVQLTNQSKSKFSESENVFENSEVVEETQEMRYQKFKQKIKVQLEEQNAESQSEDSGSETEALIGLDVNTEEDFKAYKKSVKLQKDGTIDLMEIIEKNPDKRQNDERDHLVLHLQFNVQFFEGYQKDLITSISERLKCKSFAQGQKLMSKGEIGECMFIIMSGEVGIYLEDSEENTATAVVGPGQVIGDTALQMSSIAENGNKGRRVATAIALKEVKALVLKRKDYENIIYQFKVIEKMRRLHFLQKLAFFQEFPPVKLIDINAAMEDIRFLIGQTVYDIGSPAHTFYIVVEGKLCMETIIEINNYYRFPIDKTSWDLRKKTRRIQYKLQELNKGAIFGHEEMLNNFERRSRVRAITNCKLIYINKMDLFKTFPVPQVETLRKMMRNLDLDFIVDKIQQQYKRKKVLNNAVLDAAGVNEHDFSGQRSAFIGGNKLTMFNRLKPWLAKARAKETKNQHILHQLRKVKLLFKTEEQVGVIKLNELHLHEEQKKWDARFYTPDVNTEELLKQAAFHKIQVEDAPRQPIVQKLAKSITTKLGPTDRSNEGSPTQKKAIKSILSLMQQSIK